jgi:hypothetical protein
VRFGRIHEKAVLQHCAAAMHLCFGWGDSNYAMRQLLMLAPSLGGVHYTQRVL